MWINWWEERKRNHTRFIICWARRRSGKMRIKFNSVFHSRARHIRDCVCMAFVCELSIQLAILTLSTNVVHVQLVTCSNYHFCLCHRSISLLLPTRQLWMRYAKKGWLFVGRVLPASLPMSRICTYRTSNKWKIFQEWNSLRGRQSCRRPSKSQLSPNFVRTGNWNAKPFISLQR